MMKHTLATLTFAITFSSLATMQPGISKVVKKGGQIIEGKIHGTIVLKKELGRNSANYVLVEGRDVDLIEGDSVRGHGYFTIVQANSNEPLDDVAIAAKGKNYRGGMEIGSLGDGASFMAVGFKVEQSSKDGKIEAPLLDELKNGAVLCPLLGELRCDGGVCRIIPAIEVSAENGNITIPVEEITGLKKDPQRQEQEKDKEIKRVKLDEEMKVCVTTGLQNATLRKSPVLIMKIFRAGFTVDVVDAVVTITDLQPTIEMAKEPDWIIYAEFESRDCGAKRVVVNGKVIYPRNQRDR